jgi:hypothetical protein
MVDTSIATIFDQRGLSARSSGYISERIGLARLARNATQRTLRASTISAAGDVFTTKVLKARLGEKFGESAAEDILPLISDLFSEKKFQSFSRYWAVSGLMRDFLVLRDGHIRVRPWIVKEDDFVAILSGGKAPYCLQSLYSSGDKFLGECYIPRIMFGEGCEGDNISAFKLNQDKVERAHKPNTDFEKWLYQKYTLQYYSYSTIQQ